LQPFNLAMPIFGGLVRDRSSAIQPQGFLATFVLHPKQGVEGPKVCRIL
jgi:hypothetical protein